MTATVSHPKGPRRFYAPISPRGSRAVHGQSASVLAAGVGTDWVRLVPNSPPLFSFPFPFCLGCWFLGFLLGVGSQALELHRQSIAQQLKHHSHQINVSYEAARREVRPAQTPGQNRGLLRCRIRRIIRGLGAVALALWLWRCGFDAVALALVHLLVGGVWAPRWAAPWGLQCGLGGLAWALLNPC